MKNIVLHKINGENYSYRPYGICEDIESTPNKSVTLISPVSGDDSHVFSLVNGATVLVKFSFENATDNTTLNVNETGEFPITIGENNLSQTQTWVPGDTIEFRYNEEKWVMLNGEMSLDKSAIKTFYIITDSIENIPELPEILDNGSFNINGWSEDNSILNSFVYDDNVVWSTTIRVNIRNNTAFKNATGEYE